MSSNPEQDPALAAEGADPAAVSPPQGDLQRLAAELAGAQAKAEEHRDNLLRALAETENVRKRAQRDIEAAHKFGVERFAANLLEVRDSLELGLAAGAGVDTGKLVEGMQATLRLLDKAFEKAGISLIDPAGQPFNPELHEAMVTQPTTEQPPGTVLAVVQKGYVLNGRLLRPARVVIARAPEAAS